MSSEEILEIVEGIDADDATVKAFKWHQLRDASCNLCVEHMDWENGELAVSGRREWEQLTAHVD